jgi:hypothetical protein
MTLLYLLLQYSPVLDLATTDHRFIREGSLPVPYMIYFLRLAALSLGLFSLHRKSESF